MSYRNTIIVLTVVLIGLLAMGVMYVKGKQTATYTNPSPTASAPVSQSPSPSISPSAAQNPSPSQGQAVINQVKIGLISLDNGGSVGCGDSVVLVERTVASTNAPLKAAVQDLLAQKSQYYGQSGLYNALYQSNLSVQTVSLQNGIATIKLTGTLQLGGVCDSPRVQAQLEQTALQFSSVTRADVFINGKPLKDALSQK